MPGEEPNYSTEEYVRLVVTIELLIVAMCSRVCYDAFGVI